MYELDVRLGADGKLSAVTGKADEDSPGPPPNTKGLEPDKASARWLVKEGALMITVPWKA